MRFDKTEIYAQTMRQYAILCDTCGICAIFLDLHTRRDLGQIPGPNLKNILSFDLKLTASNENETRNRSGAELEVLCADLFRLMIMKQLNYLTQENPCSNVAQSD